MFLNAGYPATRAVQVLEDYTEPMNSVRQAFEDMQDCIHKDYPVIENGQELDTMRERHVHSAVSHHAHALSRRCVNAHEMMLMLAQTLLSHMQ
jgi:hypothetical protein